MMVIPPQLTENLAKIRRWILREPVPRSAEIDLLERQQREMMLRVRIVGKTVGLQVRDPFEGFDGSTDFDSDRPPGPPGQASGDPSEHVMLFRRHARDRSAFACL